MKNVVGPETKSIASRTNCGRRELAAEDVGEPHRLEDHRDDRPDQGPERPVDRPAEADGRDVVVEARRVPTSAPTPWPSSFTSAKCAASAPAAIATMTLARAQRP